jgi:hypothetical protein
MPQPHSSTLETSAALQTPDLLNIDKRAFRNGISSEGKHVVPEVMFPIPRMKANSENIVDGRLGSSSSKVQIEFREIWLHHGYSE